jgi:hypothetical protein
MLLGKTFEVPCPVVPLGKATENALQNPVLACSAFF